MIVALVFLLALSGLGFALHHNHPRKPLPSGMGRKGVASEAR